MKTLKNLKKIYVLVLTLAIAYSCGDSDELPEKTVYELIAEESELSTFTAALEKLPSLRDVLDDNSDLITKADSFTVFVPTDNDFDAFLIKNGYDDIESVDMENPDHVEFLVTYIYNHITLETTKRSVLESEGLGYLTTNTQQEIDMFFDATGEDIVLNGAAKVIKDTDARNGVVYIVDDVIPFPTLATFVEAHPNFEVMEQALAIAESEEGSTINSDLTNAAQYTIFVPVDAAFESLYDEIENDMGIVVNDISELETNTVEHIVEFHVIVPHTNLDASDIKNAVGGSINTATVLDVDEDGDGYYTLTDLQGRTATLTRTDIRASNGFIHIIDRVLLGN